MQEFHLFRRVLRILIRAKVVVLEQLPNAAHELVPHTIAALVAFREFLQYKDGCFVRQPMSIMHHAVNTFDLHGIARAE